jgi:hypothetical protein
MKSDGYGGRAGNNQFSERVINGLLSTDEKPAGESERQCANPKCRRSFLSRQEGDDFCTDKCDARFRGKGQADKMNGTNNNDAGWDNAVKVIER